MKFLRTPILKNICEPLTSTFFNSILWSSWKKNPILKTKWQKLINKYENAFIWTLHAPMKRSHWNVSLNLYYRHAQSNSYRGMNLKLIGYRCKIYPDLNFISFLNIDHYKFDQGNMNFQFHMSQFSCKASCKGCLIFI